LKLDSKHIDYLIARYLTGEATRSEMQQLEKWMEEAGENKKYFDGIRFAHDKTIASHRIEKFDVDKGWNSLHKKMQDADNQPKKQAKTVSFNRNVFLRVAAIALILIGVGTVAYYFGTNKIDISEQLSLSAVDSVVSQKMADNSTIRLNKKGKVTIKKGFGKEHRTVELKGEAFFDVRHDTVPFIVETEKAFVKDLGTSFNVKADEGSDTVEIFVQSGVVAFYTQYNPGIIVNEGEKGFYIKSQDNFYKRTVNEANIAYARIFHFNNSRLIDVVTQVNSVYGQYITLSLGNISNCRITVSFENETIENIVNVIAETLGLHVEKIAGGYLLTGEACNNMP
jgi:ferric-dicitrate binding protein FerR (iron transport regulator)